MSHTLAFWRRYTCDISHHRLCHMRFNERSRLFFCRATDFTNHHDGFSVRIFLETFENINEVGSWDRIATDPYASRLTKAFICCLLYRFIGQSTRTRNNPYSAFFMDITWHNTNLTFIWCNHARAIRPDHHHTCFI